MKFKILMTQSFLIIQTLYKHCDSFIDELCKPNPLYIQDKIKQEFANRRNKVIVVTHVFLILSFFIDIVLNNGPVLSNLFRAFLCLVTIFFMFASCRLHPQIFKVFYTIVCMIYGPCVVDTGDEGIHTAFLGAQNLPVFVYLFTGSFWHFLFQAFVQAIYVNRLYHSLLEKAVVYMTPREFTNALIYSSNIGVVFCATLVMLTHYSMHRAYQQIAVTEKKKDEFEKQKTFLLSFSHELRNLINSLTGNVKLATLENLTDRAKELLLNAEVCGELLLHLINNILDTGKTEIGELEINPTPTRIYDTLERIWGICSELIRRKKLKGQLKVQNNLPKIMVIDHYRLTQIFLNLVGNAIKFTENGEIDITIQWIPSIEEVKEQCFRPYPFNDSDEHDEGLFEKSQKFSVFEENIVILNTMFRKVRKATLKPCENNVRKGIIKVVVRDSGCGMTKEEVGKLFHKFTQVTSDASKKKLGTGLGLFITKELCQRMGGQIKAFSKKDQGSSFIFCIPVECGQETNDQLYDLKAIRSFLNQKSLRAMLVDDVPLTHEVLKEFFCKLNFQICHIAVNGLEACEKYFGYARSEDRPQIVAMDLDMPIMDGKTASRKIREFEEDKGLSPCFLLIISGNCSESEIKECLDKKGSIRADAFLKKPATIEDIVRVIGSNINRFN